MRFNRQHKIKVLCLLVENLKNPEPQVVSVEQIAWKLQMDVQQTRQLLFCMSQAGQIQNNEDGDYALLTRAGLMEFQQQTIDLPTYTALSGC